MHKQWVYYAKTAQADIGKTLGHTPTLTEMKMLLGGKGAGLAVISSLVPVPFSFTLTPEACIAYLEIGVFPDGLWEQVLAGIHYIEAHSGKRFGDPIDPLLVAVRPGARISMPGMMDGVFYIGLNDETCETLANLTDNPWYTYDIYRHFIAMFSDTVMGYNREHFEQKLEALKEYEGVKGDTEVSLEGLIRLVKEYKMLYQTQFGEDFPADPYQQLELAIRAGFSSWNSARAIAYREHEGIPHSWGVGVNVHMMVFSNFGNNSSTGIVFSRNPATGNRHLYGEHLPNVPGDTLFWGTSNAVDIRQLSQTMPDIYSELIACVRQLENHFRDMQDLEFTVERGRLWLLQSRNGKRSSQAAVKIAVDMADEGLISREEAVMRVRPADIEQAMHPSFDPFAVTRAKEQGILLTRGRAAAPGAAVGCLVLDARSAKKWAEKDIGCILVREFASPDDVPGALRSQGVLSREGSVTGSLVLVCLGNNIPTIVGADIGVNLTERTARIGSKIIREGEIISIDGSTGEVFLGKIPTIEAKSNAELWTLLTWTDQIVDAADIPNKPGHRFQVWANADVCVDVRRHGRPAHGVWDWAGPNICFLILVLVMR
jgi:pyruvate, orthophosphate dikinase